MLQSAYEAAGADENALSLWVGSEGAEAAAIDWLLKTAPDDPKAGSQE